MEFDKRISDIMLNQLNNIERKLKVRASFFLAKEFGEDFYFNPTHFKNANKHNIFLKTTYKDVLNSGINSKNPIILHHLQNYYGRLPVWVLFEHISFGAFIKILSWLVNSNKNLIFNDIFISYK